MGIEDEEPCYSPVSDTPEYFHVLSGIIHVTTESKEHAHVTSGSIEAAYAMPVKPESAHIMSAKPKPVHVTSAKPESRGV